MSSSSKKRALSAPPLPPPWVEGIFLKAWRPYLWIAGVGFALYFRALSFGFTYLDDNALILDNFARLRDLPSLLQAFRHDVFFSHGAAAFYRPMLTLSLGLDAQLGGLSPFVYHLDNILIHLAATSLLFALFVRLGYPRGTALFSSLVFDVHPVLSQAVAWVPGRNDSLAALFALASFLGFVNWIEPEGGGGRGRNYARHLLFFALALFTKETAAVLMAACAAYALLIAKERPRGAALQCAAGWLSVLVVWYGLRQAALTNPLKMGIMEMTRSVWINLPALLQNVGKIVLPLNLSVLPTMRDTAFSYGIAAVALAVLAVALTAEKHWNRLAFGFFWFALFSLPSLVLGSTTVADFMLEHRTYLPMVGLLVVLMETGLTRNWSGREERALAAGAAVLLTLSLLACRHLGNFRDRLSFWTDAVKTSPHLPFAHRNLGAMYYLDGRVEEAEAQYKIAIALNPVEPMVHSNLGLIYMNQNKPPEAEEELRKEIAVNPEYENGYFNLGLLYYRLGRPAEAASLWEKTLALNPEHVDANADLAVYHLQQRDLEKAAFYLGRLKALDPQAYLKISKSLEQKP